MKKRIKSILLFSKAASNPSRHTDLTDLAEALDTARARLMLEFVTLRISDDLPDETDDALSPFSAFALDFGAMTTGLTLEL